VVQLAPVRIAIGWLFLLPAASLGRLSERWTSAGGRALTGSLVILALVLGLAAYARVVERRRPRELSPRRGLLEWVGGFVVGVALLSATMGVLVVLKAYRVQAGGEAGALLDGLVVYAPHALLEELLMRALLFKIAEESVGSWAAMIMQAAMFGVLHLGNPGATALGAGAIALEAGILLGAAFMYTRRLWLVWGLHVGWNLAQGSVFGVRVSGTPVSRSWLLSQPTGADALTGGIFGVEASPIAVVLCLICASWLLRGAVRRGQVVRWRDQRQRIRAAIEGQNGTH
jgi:membrane protease YdiL (CAAX protease family)